MTTSAKAALLTFVSIFVAGIMVHLFLPGGLPRLLDELTTPAVEPKPAPSLPRAPAAPASGETQLREGERAYDAGDFSRAVDLLVAARADAGPGLHERAVRGLHKAVIAWALTTRAPLPNPLPEHPDAEVALRQAAADANPSERAWYDVLVYAAGVGSTRKLPALVQSTLNLAQAGGPVMARLNETLDAGGPRASLLREAMVAEHWLDPVDPALGADAPHGPRRPPAQPNLPPSGNFKPETKAKLAQAVDLERRGRIEYDQTGPENSDRAAHRKAAYEFLKQARDIYVAAQEEDPNSRELDRHIHTVMEMLSPLRKEMGLDH